MRRIESFQDALIVDGTVVAHKLVSDVMLSVFVVIVVGGITGIKLLFLPMKKLFKIRAGAELRGGHGDKNDGAKRHDQARRSMNDAAGDVFMRRIPDGE